MKIHLKPVLWQNIFKKMEMYNIPPELVRIALGLKVATFYNKLKQYRNGGVRPRKKGTGRARTYRPKDWVPMIDDILKDLPPNAGHRRIWIRLKKKGVPFCQSTAYKILDDLSLLTPRIRRPHLRKYEHVVPERPNHICYADTKTYWVGNLRVEIYCAIDAYSRRIPRLLASLDKTSDSTVRYYCEAFGKNTPQILWTDNGTEFANDNAIALLKEMGIDWRHGPKHTPTAQGMVERVIETLIYEWLDWREYTSIFDLQQSLDEFVVWYNQMREHSAIGYEFPEVVHFATA
jgi:putative transposase